MQRPEGLIIKYLNNQLTPGEERELESWLNASDANRQLFRRITDPAYIKEKLIRRQQVNKGAEWEKLRNVILQDREKESRTGSGMRPATDSGMRSGTGYGPGEKDIGPVSGGLRPSRSYRRAAILAGLIIAGSSFLAKIWQAAPAGKDKTSLISSRASLTLSDGSEILLDNAARGLIALQGNARVENPGNGQLTYNELNEHPGKPAYNTLRTPQAGQYQLLLPDGSKVWLNNASSLRYPTAFTGKVREVELSGEACFEVAPGTAVPFIVKTSSMYATVTGTLFNIMAYAGEGPVRTTVLTGGVKLSGGSKTAAMLRPGQQAILSGPGEWKVISVVDTSKVLAWKKGLMSFESADLVTTMRILSRWYGVEVEYEDQARITRHYRFEGKISGATRLSDVLGILEQNEIHLSLEGSKIIVQP